MFTLILWEFYKVQNVFWLHLSLLLPQLLPDPPLQLSQFRVLCSVTFIVHTESNLCHPCAHGCKVISIWLRWSSPCEIMADLTRGHTLKEKWLSFPPGRHQVRPALSGGGSWAPPFSVLESWLSWSCTGLIWATIATVSLWTERCYVQEASFCSSPLVLWFFQFLCVFIACVWSSTAKGEIDVPCVAEHQIDTCFLHADGWFCVNRIQKPLRSCVSCSKHRYGRALLKPSLFRVFPKQFLTY